MTAEELCSEVPEKLRSLTVTLVNTLLAMQKKLESERSVYENIEIVQIVKSTQGERVLKANPFVVEYRATARDYSALLRDLHEILSGKSAPLEKNKVDELRRKFRVV